MFVYRSLSSRNFWTAAIKATKTTAMVMLLIGTASASATCSPAPGRRLKTIALMHGDFQQSHRRSCFLINVILLILGMFMDMAGLILICTPIFLPVGEVDRHGSRCSSGC